MRATFLAVAFLCLAGWAHADNYQVFSSIADFDATVKSLAANPDRLVSGKLYLVVGMLDNIKAQPGADKPRQVEFELIGSEWADSATLKTYRIRCLCADPRIAAAFGQPDAKTDGTRYAIHQRVLAVVELAPGSAAGKGARPVFLVHGLRLVS